MISSKKVRNVVLAVVMMFMLVITSTTDVFAASGSRTFRASGKMSVALKVDSVGTSNEVSIRVSGMPAKAVITKMTINTGSLSYTGAVLTNYLTISSNGRSERIYWGGQANTDLNTSNFLASKANGTYTISFNAKCMGGAFAYGKRTNIGTKTYNRPSITIYWDDTLED